MRRSCLLKLGKQDHEGPQHFTLVLSTAGSDGTRRRGSETHHAGFGELADALKPKARADAHTPHAAASFLNVQLGRKRANEALSTRTQFTQSESSLVIAGGFSPQNKNSFSKGFTKFPTTDVPFSRPSRPTREMQPSYRLLVNEGSSTFKALLSSSTSRRSRHSNIQRQNTRTKHPDTPRVSNARLQSLMQPEAHHYRAFR